MIRLIALTAATCLLVAGCGSKQSADYRKSGDLEHAVKAQIESEGKTVDQVACIGDGGGQYACAYKLTTGLAAVRHVTVAPDGKTWSAG